MKNVTIFPGGRRKELLEKGKLTDDETRELMELSAAARIGGLLPVRHPVTGEWCMEMPDSDGPDAA